MAEDDRGERTEAPSLKKREDARKKGMFAQSPDLSQALMLCAGIAAISSFGPQLIEALSQMMRSSISGAGIKENLATWLSQRGPAIFAPVFSVMMLICGCILLSGMGAGLLQAGIHINFELLELKWERIDPLEGIKRLFSLTSLVATIFGVMKIVLVAAVGYGALSEIIATSHQLWQQPAGGLILLILQLAVHLAWTLGLAMLCLGIADYGYKRWKYERDLMMTKDEVREENKQQEGDPHIKQRIRQIQRQRAMRRMMQEVPTATVVVTNPTHVAVALRYDPMVSIAPVVVAKGEHKLAERIKAIARQHDVPVFEEPPLARAMLRAIPVGHPIKFEFYRAVAEILAMLHRRKNPSLAVTSTGGRCA